MDTEHNGGVEVHFGVGLTRTWLCEAVPKVMAGTSLYNDSVGDLRHHASPT